MLFLGILNKKIHMAFIAHKIEGKAGFLRTYKISYMYSKTNLLFLQNGAFNAKNSENETNQFTIIRYTCTSRQLDGQEEYV